MKIQRVLLVTLALGSAFGSWQAGAEGLSPAITAFRELLADEWSTRLREDPLAATASGVRDYDERLPQVTAADFGRRFEQDREFQRRLMAIPRGALDPQDQLNYDLFGFVLHHRVALAPFDSFRIPLTSDEGFHTEVMRMASGVVMNRPRDYENYIARLRGIPAYFTQQTANMRRGLKDGFSLPSAILPGVISVLEGQQHESAEKTPFFEPFTRFPDSIAAKERMRLTDAGRAAIEAEVIPSYRRLFAFFREEYQPGARKTIAAGDLPQGQPYYAALTKFFTNLEVTPDQVHEIGLREVARIRGEMAAVIRETGFKGDFAAFLLFLRTDPQFYARTPRQLLVEASFIAKQIDGLLPAYFGFLPRLTYTVEGVPAELAPNYTAGRYVPPPIGGTNAGKYWVNTYALEKRPLYVLTALSLHEAVPGHHFQGSIARELQDVPPFRLDFYPHAFGEGWGLYSEKLGIEMGLYKTPYDNFGRLTYEMWRACRLVVDTGMHAKGWTRERALDYLAGNTALSVHEVRTEIDRYIAWPGQALAYKMGELKIIELRNKARAALGDRFDLRAFHDAVLKNGGVPLPILERQINEYIAGARKP